ncbi:MAG: acyltransferase [Acidimicrobiales bacterium]|nr:acyltransferase [Acidimicrobiales bacterium]
MKRLTGLDAGFLWMETPSSAMHVAGLAVYDPSQVPGGYSFERIRDMLAGRLHLAPPFRRRLATVPFEIHHPLWIEDPDFDLDWHVRRIGVPAPGGPRELAELAAHLDALQLDRQRPLWELWVIEGLEGGNIATLTKVHHAAIDGASGNEILVSLFDLSPEVADHPEPEPWQADTQPSEVEMLGHAVSSLVRQPWKGLRAVRRTAAAALNVRALDRPGRTAPPMPFTAPRTSLNGALTPARSAATTSLSLADAKRVKNAFGATVNDVVLALCSGALRHYFDRRGEVLDGPLVAMVPVSVRPEAEKDAMGNQVSSIFTSLASDIDDPVVRLLAIHEGMRHAKDQHHAIGADTLQDWAEFAAPAVFGRAMRLYSRTRMADRHRPVFNVTISNVPGPPFPLWSAGAKLLAHYPLGPIFDGGGLNMTVMSYQDSLDFGLLACPDVVDDVWSIADGLRLAMAELLEAVAEREQGVDAVHDAERVLASVPGAVAGPTDRRVAPGRVAANGTATVMPPAPAAEAEAEAGPKKASPKRAAATKTGAKRAAAKKASPKPAAAKKASPKKTGAKRTAVKTSSAKRAATNPDPGTPAADPAS